MLAFRLLQRSTSPGEAVSLLSFGKSLPDYEEILLDYTVYHKLLTNLES